VSPNECFFMHSLRSVFTTPPTHWNTIVFKCRFFRHTEVILITIIVPIVFLSFINLAIFFQEQSLANRISSIVMLLLAYTTFLPIVRNRIPPSPKITLIQLLLYAVMLSSTLCLLRSFLNRNIPSDDYNWQQDPCFVISLITLLLVSTLVFIGYLGRKRRHCKNE